MKVRSVAKWTVTTGLVGLFSYTGYLMLAQGEVAKAAGKTPEQYHQAKFVVPYVSGLCALVIAVTAL